jgi:hypothetical protein
MPIQNIGTLLENIVLLEAARALMSCTQGRLALLNAFTMPPLGPWREAAKYEYQGGFSDAILDHVAAIGTPAADSYVAFLQRCLRYDRTLGPSGALLVALMGHAAGRKMEMWLNDLADPHSHYPGTVGGLQDFLGTLATLGTAGSTSDRPRVCTVPYPLSLEEMTTSLSEMAEAPLGGLLGFLDPNCYNRDVRDGPQTSSKDHREWLERLSRAAVPTLAVHFTSKRDTPTLLADVGALHVDGQDAGYSRSRAFKHSTYVVSVNAFHPSGVDAAQELLVALSDGVVGAWKVWYRDAVRRSRGPAALGTFIDGSKAAPE